MSLSDDLSTESPPDAFLVIDACEGQGQRLDQFLTRHLQARLDGISRTRIQRWIALGAVRVDQQVRLPSLRLKGVESIEVEPQPLESDTAFAPDPVPLAIIHQDADITVIDKPAGLVTRLCQPDRPAGQPADGTTLSGHCLWPDAGSRHRRGQHRP